MENKRSYLYVEDLDGVERMSDQNFVRPSQYFRKMVADKIGAKNWDWRKYPDKETMEKTLDKLRAIA